MFDHIGIPNIDVYVPPMTINIEELSRSSGIEKNLLLDKLGVKSKPILSYNNNIVDMAVIAVKKLILSSSIDPLSIDYIIYCSTGLHDKYLWSPAAKVQNEIGATNAFSFEINNGCNAGNVGINVAANFLKSAPDKNNALVIVCDALSRIVNHENPQHMCIYNFSDASAAILVKRGESKNNILGFSAITLPEFVDHMHVSKSGGFVYMADDDNEDKRLSTAYKKIYVSMIKSALNKTNLTADNIDHLFINQGDHKLIKFLSETLRIPKKNIYVSYEEYGHMGGSDIFFALNNMLKDGKIKSDEIIILASSAVGFSWGATVIRA